MTAYIRERFQTCSGTYIEGPVLYRGARGVALLDKQPDPQSQYPSDRDGYVSVYLFDKPWGRIQERHSHGYGVSWMDYFRALLDL